ncbi:MAG: hypothetical protein JO061_20085 [Acidobacteriaceae bacterium]|nr:hypothetical protein [Acidobacteriaceae bacterium]
MLIHGDYIYVNAQTRRLAITAALLTGWIISPASAQTSSSSVSDSVGVSYASRLTVTPKAPSRIAMKVLPNGSCVLHAEGSNDSEHSLKLFADSEGQVQFHVQPLSQSADVARFQVDCQADGQSAQFPLELRADWAPTPDMPAPAVPDLHSTHGGKIRPALTPDDAAHLSAEELLRGEYPPRPNPQQAPDAYASWLRAVTKPATFVPARLMSNAGITHTHRQVTAGSETSSNWSGFELQGPPFSFDSVFGTWNVPAIALGEPDKSTYSAFWIGIDGDPAADPFCFISQICDLVQEGTEQDMTEICFFGACFDFTNYYAWSEFLPQQQTEQVIGGFHVNPGDEIYSTFSLCSFGIYGICFSQYNGTQASFVMENISRSEYTQFYVPRGGTFVNASEAEWIMERPTVNGSLPDLSTYLIAVMNGAYACNTGFPDSANCMNYNSPKKGFTSQKISMYNGKDLLSFPIPVSSTEMEFFWTNWH